MSTLIEIEGRDPVRLTEAQIRGLRVVAASDGRARLSNVTDERTRTVYWQTVRSLIRLGLIERDGHDVGDALGDLTPLVIAPGGWAIVHALDDLAGADR